MTQSEITSTTQTADANTSEAPPPLEHLGQLLQDSEPAAQNAASDNPGDDTPAAPKKFNDLAERTGLDLDTLYKLELHTAEDGTPVTIETLKDRYTADTGLTVREMEFEERKTREEGAILQAQEQLRELMAALPERAIKPEVLQKLRDNHEAKIAVERQRTLEIIPEWQDEARRTADIEGMAAHLERYGYPPTHLGQIADHRQLRYIRDNWQRELRIRKALEAVKAGKPNPTTRQKPASKSPAKAPLAGVKRGNYRDTLESVFSQVD